MQVAAEALELRIAITESEVHQMKEGMAGTAWFPGERR